jgi:hypothetical protein
MESCSNPAQRFVVLGAQVVGTVLMAELVEEQPHHVLGDAVVEPVRAEPEFVEDQFAAGAVGRAAQMMRRAVVSSLNLVTWDPAGWGLTSPRRSAGR